MLTLCPVLGRMLAWQWRVPDVNDTFALHIIQYHALSDPQARSLWKFLNLIWLLLISALWFKQEFMRDKIKIQWLVLGSSTSFLLIAPIQFHRPVCLEFAACKAVRSAHSVCGICPLCLWDLPTLSVGSAHSVCEICPLCLWDLPALSVRSARSICEICPLCLWDLPTLSVRSARSVWVQSPAEDFLLRQAYSQSVGR